MATVIFNSNNFTFNRTVNNQSPEEIPLHKRDLVTHIGTCLKQLPPKQLGRCLRTTFMLNWEQLVCTCPNFKDFLTELIILLERLDAEEDGRVLE
jgi:hypothetical protein